MKKFKANEIDVQSMSRINGGDVNITLKDVKTIITSKSNAKAMAMENDTTIEISGTITIEK